MPATPVLVKLKQEHESEASIDYTELKYLNKNQKKKKRGQKQPK